ncbi:MAG: hypothetical protein U0S12_14840 [Fimbriimonadales bacterium]
MAATLRIDIVPHDGGEHDLVRLEEASGRRGGGGPRPAWSSAPAMAPTQPARPAVHVFEGKLTGARAKMTDDGVGVVSLAFDTVTPVRAVN